jgi:hypothetical protein
VVRNGSHQPREVLTAAGAVEVVAPRVNDRRIDPDTRQRRRFTSAILPPWCRKTPKITEVLPLLPALPKSAHPGAEKAPAEIWKRRTLRQTQRRGSSCDRVR